MFRFAQPQDLSEIIRIYNQVIESRIVTADLTPVTPAERQARFDSHYQHPKYPLWVLEHAADKQDKQIVGWCSYSAFYSRAAYDGTAEISFYLDSAVQGKGLGRQTVAFLQAQMPQYGLSTLLGFVFGNNKPSLGLLEKCGFEPYGRLPKVADMQTHREDLVILGYCRL